MKSNTSTLGRASLVTAGALLLAGAQASAQVAYEGFNAPKLSAVPTVDAPDGTALAAVTATGNGFENWIVTNKGVAGDSRYVSAGLSYPTNYDGSLAAIGGSAVIDATSGGNATHSLMFDVTALSAVTAADEFYFSFLAERVGDTSTSTAVNDPPDTALYPRNFGIRYLNGAGNSNSNIGTLGRSGNWNQSDDVWGQWGAKDVHGLLSSENFADGTDLVVVGVTGANSAGIVSIWFNPDSASTTPDISYNFTDGEPLAFNLTGIGTEAGNLSGERQPSIWNLDEIRVGLTSLEAAGLSGLVATAAIPEPSIFGALLGLGAIGFAMNRRRR